MLPATQHFSSKDYKLDAKHHGGILKLTQVFANLSQRYGSKPQIAWGQSHEHLLRIRLTTI